MKVNIAIIGRRWAAASALAAGMAITNAAKLPAQTAVVDSSRAQAMSVTDSARIARRKFYQKLAAGFAASIFLHEAAHFSTAYAMGFHPHLGFDKGRPTVFSGIDESVEPRKQFIFSASGLIVQNLLDEIVLDVPHRRGGAFERGVLAGGIGTTLFYVTIGRNARVSDMTLMDRTSHLTKGQLSLIFGSVSALHAFRMSRDRAYSRFFVAPVDRGRGLNAGLSMRAP